MAMFSETLHHNCDNLTDRSSTQLSLNDAACWNHESKILLTIQIHFKNFDQFPQLRRIFYISKSVQSAWLHKTLGFRKFEDKSERRRAVGTFCQFSASVLPAAASLSRDSNLVDKGHKNISYKYYWPNEPRLKRTSRWFLWKQSTLL